ncbi:MAG TPA: phage holin family protein [Acidimicrobiales bacterium]|nr:phage holin family protein [Acidimicrobiales bacterium]
MAPRSDLRDPASADAEPHGGTKSIPEVVSDLWELTTSYAKQETIDPLKGLGRFLGFGIGGAIALGVGVVLLLLAGLRALQTETSTTFTGNLSWAPYLIIVAVGTVLIALALLRVTKRKGPGA